MTPAGGPELLQPVAQAALAEIADLRRRTPGLLVLDFVDSAETRRILGESAGTLPQPDLGNVGEGLRAAARHAHAGGRAVVVGRAAELICDGYRVARDELARGSLAVLLLGIDAGLPPDSTENFRVVVDDLALVRAIPGVSAYAPADARSASAATAAALAHAGPVYERLPPGQWPSVTQGAFDPGRAPVILDGADLTLAAAGPLLGRAITVATELRKVGVGARVLDCASVRPLDEGAVIRAARETGALLTVEDHHPWTGLGGAVAALVSAEAPVPVRTLGVPEIFLHGPPDEVPWDAAGLSVSSLMDEAWELLRLRGKVQ